MRLNYCTAAKCEPHRSRTTAFSRFKDLAKPAATACSLLLAVPALLPFSRARAVQVPSTINWVGGIDLYKQPVRDYFRSKSIPVTQYAVVDPLPVGQMSPMRFKTTAYTSTPYRTRNPLTGMAYQVWISHGFFYAGGDSLMYKISFACDLKMGAIRDRAYSWEIATYSRLHRVDARWSSSRPSYLFNMEGAQLFPLLGSVAIYSADYQKDFIYATRRMIDTTYVTAAPAAFQFCHAMNYGEGNWGSKRKWLGVSGIDRNDEGVTFFDLPPAARHQVVRPFIYPIPSPDSSHRFLGWVLDTVFWKAPPSDSTAPYDMKSRLDSARFAFALLDSECSYIAPYPLQAGETGSVTAGPGGVFKLPVPRRLVPFAGYGGRHGELADPYYQLANIHNPNIDYYTVDGLVIAPFELVFYQDSTAKCGPWYTRMGGGTVKNVVNLDNPGQVDTGSQYAVDSLVMWRYVKLPSQGDTAYVTRGDEYSTQFNSDSCGAKFPFDPLIAGFYYGDNYATVGTAGAPPAVRVLPAVRPVGKGTYEIELADGAGRISVFDLRGREVRTFEARHGKALVTLEGLSPGAYMIGAPHSAIRALLPR